MAKILSIVETAYRGILEEQDDTILWVNAMFKKGGADLSFLLRSNAVNYAVKGQDMSGLQLGNITQKHAPDIAGDLAQIVGSGAPVYVVSEDLQERGIRAGQLVDGVKTVSRSEIPGLFDRHEQMALVSGDWSRFDRIDFDEAAKRLEGVVRATPLEPVAQDDPRIELRAKLENTQETGSFKARGAWNQISRLTDEQRRAGVVTVSSGNHGKALSWAAQRAGVPATIIMPQDAYPNKIEACREFGAQVVLSGDRWEGERACEERVQAGAVLIHPYDAERTVQGAGTVGREIARDWPGVEVVVVPVGGGGLISGSSLALRRALGASLHILGAEPAGAPSMSLGLEAGKPVDLEEITTEVQGLCPPNCGGINIEICGETLDGVHLLPDAAIFAAQEKLVKAGHVVEPAGAAAAALVFSGGLSEEWLQGRGPDNPLQVAVVISGGNPDPEQLARILSQ